jgi:hypothetical protein
LTLSIVLSLENQRIIFLSSNTIIISRVNIYNSILLYIFIYLLKIRVLGGSVEVITANV